MTSCVSHSYHQTILLSGSQPSGGVGVKARDWLYAREVHGRGSEEWEEIYERVY